MTRGGLDLPTERKDSAGAGAPCPETRAPGSPATAALGLAVLLSLITWSSISSDLPPVGCEFPREVASERGWTTDVGCDVRVDAGMRLRGPARLLFGLSLDLNHADPEALEVLPRIGPRRAAAIVRAREQAAFSSVAELARVPGIGAKTIEGLAGWVAVGEAE